MAPNTNSQSGDYCERCGKHVQPASDALAHSRCAGALDLEPPRYCGRCARRMVVQVTPTGWTARCVEHGTRSNLASA